MGTPGNPIDFSSMPNPLAPQAWLPATESDANRILHFTIAGLLAISIWEFLSQLPRDYMIVFKRKFTLQTLTFVVTRLSCIVFMITSALAVTTEAHSISCHRWHMVTTLTYAVVHCAAGLLFYFRVVAVFPRNPKVIWFFRIAWVVMLAANLILTFMIDNFPIQPTKYCFTKVTSKAAVEVAMIQGSYDLLVCAAITYGLSFAGGQSDVRWKDLFRFKRSGFRHLRARFLQDSQIYFLLTASTKLPEAIVFLFYYSSDKETALQFIVAYPDTFLVATIATKIYRNLKLGEPGLLSRPTTYETSFELSASRTTGTDSARTGPHVYPPTQSKIHQS